MDPKLNYLNVCIGRQTGSSVHSVNIKPLFQYTTICLQCTYPLWFQLKLSGSSKSWLIPKGCGAEGVPHPWGTVPRGLHPELGAGDRLHRQSRGRGVMTQVQGPSRRQGWRPAWLWCCWGRASWPQAELKWRPGPWAAGEGWAGTVRPIH